MPSQTNQKSLPNIAWILALWRSLHGGTRALEEQSVADVAAEVVASLWPLLTFGENAFAFLLPQSTSRAAIPDPEIATSEDSVEALHAGPDEPSDSRETLSIHHYYFRDKGVLHRVLRPNLARSPAAA